jgi:hypothetical protein
MVTTEVDTFMIPVVIDDATGVYTYSSKLIRHKEENLSSYREISVVQHQTMPAC